MFMEKGINSSEEKGLKTHGKGAVRGKGQFSCICGGGEKRGWDSGQLIIGMVSREYCPHPGEKGEGGEIRLNGKTTPTVMGKERSYNDLINRVVCSVNTWKKMPQLSKGKTPGKKGLSPQRGNWRTSLKIFKPLLSWERGWTCWKKKDRLK